MPGFGGGPFGSGGFGQWPWSLEVIAGSVPDIYKELDATVGNNRMAQLLQVVGQSMDEARVKIHNFDDLRDIFKTPTDKTFNETVQILQVDNLGDGTSRVFISNGTNADKFDSIRLGQTIQDFTQTRFSIIEINASALPSDFATPIPTDPHTGLQTAKNIIVNNVSQSAGETLPMVSGTRIDLETPVSGQYAVGHVNNGTTAPPYIFTVSSTPMAGNAVAITWTEGGVVKTGAFTNKGQPTGDLGIGSTVNFAAGIVQVFTKDLGTADAFSIALSYTHLPATIPEDGTINSQHILALLGADFAVSLDRHDPELFQRSFVNHSFQLWDIKGSGDGYKYMGAVAGYFVKSFGLYRIDRAWVGILPSIDVFQLAIPGDSNTTIDPVLNNMTLAFSSSSAPADGASTITTTITLLDANNVAIVGQAVELSSSNPGVLISPSTPITNGSGVATATITSTVNQKVIISAKITIAGVVTTLTDQIQFSAPYTDIDPRRPTMDEVPADYIPTDLFDFDPGFPTVTQNVTVTSVALIRIEGTNFRNKVVVTPNAGQMNRSLAYPVAVFTDSGANIFEVENYQLLSTTTYSFEVLGAHFPATGAATVKWETIPVTATIPVVISGTPSVQDFGVQYSGIAGHRVRIQLAITGGFAGSEAMLAPVIQGNWAVTFSTGQSAWVETMTWDGTVFCVQVVTPTLPTQGTDVYLYYVPDIVPSCDWCRASVIRVLMTPDAIAGDLDALADDPATRLTNRLSQMVPAHIRYSQFVYDPGPAIAAYPTMHASSTSSEDDNPADSDPADFSARFDARQARADDLQTPGTLQSGIGNGFSMLVATSDSTTVSPFIFEENVDGSTSPLSAGWTASGLWHVTITPPAGQDNIANSNFIKPSGIARFGYGTTDPNTPFQQRIDLNGMPNSGSLTSPLIAAVGAATTINLEFWHYFFADNGSTNYLPSVDVLDSGGVVLHTFNKAALGGGGNHLVVDGWTQNPSLGTPYASPPQWTPIVLDIKPYVLGAGQFRLRWNFDTVTNTIIDPTYEGWFVDDIVVRVA